MRVKGSRVGWSVISGKRLAYIQIKKEERTLQHAPLFTELNLLFLSIDPDIQRRWFHINLVAA